MKHSDQVMCLKNEIHLVSQQELPNFRLQQLIEMRELLIHFIKDELKSFNSSKTKVLVEWLYDLKKFTQDIILAIAEWRD